MPDQLSAQLVGHSESSELRTGASEPTRYAPITQPPRQGCPAGATFSERSLRKSVAPFRRKIHFLEPGAKQGRKIRREEHRKKEEPAGVTGGCCEESDSEVRRESYVV